METLPEGYRDAIHSKTDVHLSFGDRIKILLGWKFSLLVITYCEYLPGKVYSTSQVEIFQKSKHVGFIFNNMAGRKDEY